MVTSSKQKWEQKVPTQDTNVDQIAEELEVSKLFVEICFQRGLTTAEEIKNFIQVDETWFHDPFLMYDMEKAITRMTEALENNEKITVYGDYDADGMTSTALLTETLESLGARVDYYLPSRFVEGYGPNTEAFEKIIAEGTTLIITVDNGVAGHEAIEFAQDQGIDVIVTDHHELPEKLPAAYAIVHPKHPKGEYPFTELAGAGVAFKVATALLGEIPVETLDLAAIGTVADLVALTDENRAIVSFGLKMIEQTQRIGLLQLLNIIDKNPDEVTEETIGFQIAPRLNAVGRLGEAGPCVELLWTHDLERARTLAEYVNEKNEERKAIVQTMTEEVKEQLAQESTKSEVLVLANEKWHQGVLGIVASRVVEATNKPTLLFTIDQEAGIAKGSARSINGFNLYEALLENEHLFTQFGGHYMAAGMSAEVEQLKEIQNELSAYAKSLETFEPVKQVDAYAALAEISTDSIQEIEQLRPFGTGNEKPIVVSEPVTIRQKRKVGADGNHLKLLIGQEEETLDIISFQKGYVYDLLFEDQEVAVAGYLENNVWNGFSKPQMQMLDIDIPGPILIDNRLNNIKPENLAHENIDYVFYQKVTYQAALKHIPDTATAHLLPTIDAAKEFEATQPVVLVDCPDSLEQFVATIAANDHLPIRCYFYKKNHLFLSGLPNRADFAKAYQYFATHKNIDLKNKGHLLGQQLNMDINKIFLIVQVFLEAKFVIINSGVLNIVEHPETKDIQKTKTYQKALKQMKAEKLFIYSSFKEVIAMTRENS